MSATPQPPHLDRHSPPSMNAEPAPMNQARELARSSLHSYSASKRPKPLLQYSAVQKQSSKPELLFPSQSSQVSLFDLPEKEGPSQYSPPQYRGAFRRMTPSTNPDLPVLSQNQASIVSHKGASLFPGGPFLCSCPCDVS